MNTFHLKKTNLCKVISILSFILLVIALSSLLGAETPFDAYVLLKNFLEDSDREKLLVVCLDTKNQPINICTVSVGTLNSSLVHPREVFKVAILTNAFKIICFHNHQSGNTDFSREDEVITKRL